jgi:hypothetical protein
LRAHRAGKSLKSVAIELLGALLRGGRSVNVRRGDDSPTVLLM